MPFASTVPRSSRATANGRAGDVERAARRRRRRPRRRPRPRRAGRGRSASSAGSTAWQRWQPSLVKTARPRRSPLPIGRVRPPISGPSWGISSAACGPICEAQHADLAREGEQGDSEGDDRQQRGDQAEAEPLVGRERAARQGGDDCEGGGEHQVACNRARADRRLRAEAGARRARVAGAQRHHEREREGEHQDRRRVGGGVDSGGHAGREQQLDADQRRPRPADAKARQGLAARARVRQLEGRARDEDRRQPEPDPYLHHRPAKLAHRPAGARQTVSRRAWLA